MSCGGELRNGIPTGTDSFGIPLRRLVRGANVDNREAIDILDNTGPATYEAFYVGDEDALVGDEEAVEDDFCPNCFLVAEPGLSKGTLRSATEECEIIEQIGGADDALSG